jgi:hypothetical protein
VTPELDTLLTALTRQLGAARGGREPLLHSSLASGRALLRGTQGHEAELTEGDHRRLDTLFGLVRWGELVYPLLRLDPWVFAEARRSSRVGRTPQPRTANDGGAALSNGKSESGP